MAIKLNPLRYSGPLIQDTYNKLVKKRFNAPIKRRPLTGKLLENAAKFVALSKATNISVATLMAEAFDYYGRDFCTSKIKTKWPPLGLVISEKSMERLANRPARVIIKKENLEEVALSYVEILDSVPRAEAVECVRQGWPTGPQELRTEILKLLGA